MRCIELKSLKYYLLSYRDVGIVQEHAANRILNDLVDACQPRSMKVDLDYKTRGGIHTSVTVQHTTPVRLIPQYMPSYGVTLPTPVIPAQAGT